jgi:riboflavin kinase / FMN adenylyltransferase
VKVTRLPAVEPRPRRVAVGTFDGVHRGHREVIRGSDTVLTFDPHPLTVIAPPRAPRLLTTLERKAELVAGLGVEEMVVVPFDHEFAALTAHEFIDRVLVDRLRATHVSVGENFRFGHGAEGDAARLAADDRFETRIAKLIEVDGEVVSSSHIRGLVLGGAVEYADELLAAPFTISDEVVHGDKRGRELGYPTANLIPRDGYVTPGHGVYACRATLADGRTYAAATNVGVRPMFVTGRGELIEAYLLDFDEEIYGEPLRLEFLKRLRGEKRFDSVDALVAQMDQDVDEARAVAG